MEIKILNFRIIGDERGSLIALEEGKNIPFEIKRVFYIFDTKNGVVRGLHAHKTSEQILISISGSCKIILDNGKEKTVLELNQRNQGLCIGPMVWREMFDFSPDCVLMVLASNYYHESDYIRDYETFKKILKGN